jgi:hypothetical protein
MTPVRLSADRRATIGVQERAPVMTAERMTERSGIGEW